MQYNSNDSSLLHDDNYEDLDSLESNDSNLGSSRGDLGQDEENQQNRFIH